MSDFSSESDEEANNTSRLGACEVCNNIEARYTCPKCEVKTCCLKCVNIHKKELECDGVRDRTKFIRMENFTNSDLLSDYRLLEECSRFVDEMKRDEKKRYTRIDNNLPIHLLKLKMAANERGTALQFLLQNFTRHKANTTRLIFKTGVINWRIEWYFPNAEPKPLKFVDERCDENIKLGKLLDKYINPNTLKFDGQNSLTYYHAAGMNNIRVLIKAERIKGSGQKYYELDPSETMKDNLGGKCIIEFPMICVILKSHSYNLDIVKPDDYILNFNKNKVQKVEAEESVQPKNNDCTIETSEIQNKRSHYFNNENNRRLHRPLLTEQYEIDKKKELEQEIKEEKKKKLKNLLFTTGYSSDENIESSDCDDD